MKPNEIDKIAKNAFEIGGLVAPGWFGEEIKS